MAATAYGWERVGLKVSGAAWHGAQGAGQHGLELEMGGESS